MHQKITIAPSIGFLAACGSEQEATRDPVPTGEDVSKATPMKCGTASITFEDDTKNTLPAALRPGGDAYGKLKSAIDAAMLSACRNGVIDSVGLEYKGKTLQSFLVQNAPNANVTGIYPDGKYAVLEAPMYSPDRPEVSIPEAGDIEEALYCYEVGPPEGENPDGRCLPD